MKIIHVVDSSIQNFDGVATYINELILSSENRGDEVMLFCTTPSIKSNLRPINFKGTVKAYSSIRVPGRPKFLVPINFGLTKEIEDFNPDLIWIHSIGTMGLKVASLAKDKYKVICTKHSFEGELWCLYLEAPKPFHSFIHAGAAKFEKIVADSCAFFVYHIHDISKIKHLEYYDKFQKFNPPLQTRFFENRFEKPLEENKLTFGFCGRCEADKGIEETYVGLQKFKEKHPEIEITFYLIGDGPITKTTPLQYPDINTIVTGYTTDVIPFLDKLDGFILSSKHETISLSTLEAYTRGIPIFSLPIGYLSEIKDIENYYLFEDNEKLVEQLEKVFVIEKKGRKIPDDEKLSKITISYPQLLNKVIQKLKELEQ